jgi:hypothetical protein
VTLICVLCTLRTQISSSIATLHTTVFLEFFVVDAERKFNTVCQPLNKKLYAADAGIVTRAAALVWTVFLWSCRMIITCICITPFDLKQGARSVAFMNSVAWAPFVLPVCMMVLFPLLKPHSHKRVPVTATSTASSKKKE